MGCISNFKFPFENNTLDFDDAFVRKEWFTEGGLWLWGSNGFGSSGTNSTVNQSSPAQTVSGGTNWRQTSGGTFHIAGIKTDGTLWLWGRALEGGLGNNSTINRSSPVQTISAGTNWKQIELASDGTTGAIKTDGTLWMWGFNDSGQLGNNSYLSRSSPIQTVSATTNWKQISLNDQLSTAVKTDGTLWTWGFNYAGQLGNNSTIDRSSPVQTVSATTDWKTVSAGKSHVAAIKTNGTLWLWGQNFGGKIGNNSTIDQSSPVQTVSGGTNWKQISLLSQSSTAIKTDGTLWTWGYGSQGSLGNNSTVDVSSPVQTVAGGTSWKCSTSGVVSTAATKNDGTLWLWGSNDSGQLGNNSTINQSSPIQTVVGGTNWVNVSVNDFIVSGIRESCW